METVDVASMKTPGCGEKDTKMNVDDILKDVVPEATAATATAIATATAATEIATSTTTTIALATAAQLSNTSVGAKIVDNSNQLLTSTMTVDQNQSVVSKPLAATVTAEATSSSSSNSSNYLEINEDKKKQAEVVPIRRKLIAGKNQSVVSKPLASTVTAEATNSSSSNSSNLKINEDEKKQTGVVPVRRKLIAGKTLLMRRPWKVNTSNGSVNRDSGAINQTPQMGNLPQQFSTSTNAAYPVECVNNNNHNNQYVHNYYMHQQQQAMAYQHGQQHYAAQIPGSGGIANYSNEIKQVTNNTSIKAISKVPAKAKCKSSPKIKLTTGSEKTPRAVEVFSGKPNEALEGGWPDGWKKKTMKRMGGKTAGSFDSYWISPKMNYRLRSMKEVTSFLAALKAYDGNEQEAKKNRKNF